MRRARRQRRRRRFHGEKSRRIFQKHIMRLVAPSRGQQEVAVRLVGLLAPRCAPNRHQAY
eukprot:351378-Chlamydomonas_euryale.AAC.3